MDLTRLQHFIHSHRAEGLPAGYETDVFLGQLDLSGDRQVLPMLNVLEADSSEISQFGDLIVSEIIPFDAEILQRSIANISAAIGADALTLKQTVIDSEKAIALSAFRRANPLRLRDILRWGLNIEQKMSVGVNRSDDREIVELLRKGVEIERDERKTAKMNTIASLPPTIIPAPLPPSTDRNLGDLVHLSNNRRAATDRRKGKDLDPVTGDLG